MTFVTHLISFAIGVIIAGAYARGQIVKIQAEALALIVPRHSLTLPPEDIARRVGC